MAGAENSGESIGPSTPVGSPLPTVSMWSLTHRPGEMELDLRVGVELGLR